MPELSADAGSSHTAPADRDVPCPCCGYNLRGLVGRRCPECGELFTAEALAAATELRVLRRACWAGFGYSLGAIVAAAAVLMLSAGRDPLYALALVLPGAFGFVWACLLVPWIAAARRPARLLVVQLFTGLAWSVGTILLLILFAMLLLGP